MSNAPTNELRDDFNRRGPWSTGFQIAGELYGSRSFIPDGLLEQRCLSLFPDAREIIELGSLECGRTRYFAESGRRVIAIEGRIANIERAGFIRSLFKLANVELHYGNLEQGIAASPCDLVYAVGILYHLPRPWELLNECAKLSPNLFLWTHIARDHEATVKVGGNEYGSYMRYQEHGIADPLSGLSPVSLWPTRAALLTMLDRAGYAVRQIVSEEPGHPAGAGDYAGVQEARLAIELGKRVGWAAKQTPN